MAEAAKQKHYRIDCPECRGTGRVQRYIGHPGRVAEFVCFACTGGDPEAEAERAERTFRATQLAK